MLKRFIEDPVLSTVISILLVILGILGITTLPITQYPDIAPPTVQVSAQYPGANAQTVLRSVIVPLEQQINGVEGMTYMTSSASNNGTANITIFFNQNYDPDIAAVNVQNRVALANPLLPSEVKQIGVSTKKQQTSALMYISFYSDNPKLGNDYVANYLNINVIPVIQRINGVGAVTVYSSQTYAMRIWVKPEKLAAYGLQPSDVATAINAQSQEAAAGVLGQSSGQTYSYTITYPGRLEKAEQFKNIILRANGDGTFLRLKDVADVELGVQAYTVASHTKGFPSISMAIFQTKGSNAREIIDQIKTNLNTLEKDFPPGMKSLVNYDSNNFLSASIEKVIHTLIEAFILVFIVVFLFLQDFRSTLIPAIAVPVSIIGTFFFMDIFGYSINLLTLFAMVLAIGMVVDDAIVVVEVVHAEIDKGAQNVRQATIKAMKEIASAIVSITLVMAAVFVPVTFIQGPSGVFFKQFGVTLMTAIVISAVNALTLSPALCALILKPKKIDENGKVLADQNDGKRKGLVGRSMGKFHAGFNRAFGITVDKYGKALHYTFIHKWITPVVILISGIAIWAISQTVPTGFVPTEDQNIIMINSQLSPGSSVDRTQQANEELRAKIMKIPGVADVSLVAGYSILSGQGDNFGLGYLKLKDIKERTTPDQSIDTITKKLFAIAGSIPDATFTFFAPPSIPGFSASGGFTVNILDKSGGSFDHLNQVTDNFVKELNARPEIQYAQSSFSTQYPQYQLTVNVPLAVQSGVDINSIFQTLQGYIGGIYTADFSRFGQQYRIYIQALPNARVKVGDLDDMYVKTANGSMAPITQFVTLTRVYGPQTVTRFNMFNSTAVNGAPNPGFSTGDAIKAVQEVAQKLPKDFTIDYSGLTREEVRATGQTFVIFMLVIIFTYFLLAAQYKSYLLPFSILLAIPIGIMGAFFFTKILGLENNIYFQISLIMLVGLLAKNAILIVEFAIQRRRAGETLMNSAIDGAKARLRPILMTSFAFIFGLMPLVVATGVGAHGNRSIGTGAVGGMLVGTIFGVFVIPTLYVFFQWLQEKITRPENKMNKEYPLEE